MSIVAVAWIAWPDAAFTTGPDLLVDSVVASLRGWA
jgi:hypothetical protein